MIPINLKLTNFISYASMEEPLSFTSFHTACLCGPNGHGKSTLLDAITWALWGQARGVDRRGSGTDDLIHAGRNCMAVEFEFELDDQRYRVARTRELGRVGTTRLDFSIIEGDEPRSLNGETIAQTQGKIDRLLRMGFDTFTNSAFMLQGRIDSFMAKSPNERKEVLSEILGLSVYEELEERAKDKRRLLDRELATLDAAVIAIEGELARKDEYESALAEADSRAGELRVQIQALEAELSILRDNKARRDGATARLADLEARHTTALKELEQLKKQVAEAVGEREELAALTNRSLEIETGAAHLREARSREEMLVQLSAKHAEFSLSAQRLRADISAKRAKTATELEQSRKEVESLALQSSKLDELKARVLELDAEAGRLKENEDRRDTLRHTHAELAKEKGELTGRLPSIIERLEEVRENIASIEGAETCPLCRKGLEADERDALLNGLKEQDRTLLEEAQRVSSRIELIETDLNTTAEEGRALSEALNRRGEIHSQLGRVNVELAGAEEASRRLEKQSAELTEMERVLSAQEFAREEVVALKSIEKELESLGYSDEEHRKLREELKSLLKFDKEGARLEAAREREAALARALASLEESIRTKERQVTEDAVQIEGLKVELRGTDYSVEIKAKEGELTVLAQNEKGALEAAAVARSGVFRCDELAKEKRAIAAKRNGLVSLMQTYADLAVAFSKKGIPALIIENAIPEIEEETNAILKKLTGGMMSVRFVTQRGQKTGGVVETLDLVIADGELGEKKYDLFSGGEAFRINFAVRIAISKLLTRRAGARLEFLVIDEGFGTQDEEGRDRLVEAINIVASDFKKIVIITHLDELKEAFPARIEVLKKPGIGSVATVV